MLKVASASARASSARCANAPSRFCCQGRVLAGPRATATNNDLPHEIFGREGDGFHARSALGFAQLPTGAAVEVEAIFEIK